MDLQRPGARDRGGLPWQSYKLEHALAHEVSHACRCEAVRSFMTTTASSAGGLPYHGPAVSMDG